MQRSQFDVMKGPVLVKNVEETFQMNEKTQHDKKKRKCKRAGRPGVQ